VALLLHKRSMVHAKPRKMRCGADCMHARVYMCKKTVDPLTARNELLVVILGQAWGAANG
jgi:hypothetical protein